MFLIAWLLIFGFIGYGIYTLAKKSIVYVASPLNPETDDREDEDTDVDENDGVLKVAIKGNNLDTSRIIEYTGEVSPTFSWYPKTLKQFVGQEEAKEQANIICEKMKRNIKSHLIISALQGSGKSTFIRLLANKLDAHLIERVGKQVDEDGIIDIINEINQSKKDYVIFFLDEIDSADPKVIKILNPILQDFKINDKQIKPFIFGSATINKDILIKNNPDTLDRIPHHIQFKRYTIEELSLILNQYVSQLYTNENIKAEDVRIISKNCKYNPRLALGILEDYIITKSTTKTFKNRRIIKDGLTEIDVMILKVLNEADRAIGANAVALRAGLTQKQYEREFEPFLYYEKYINRTPSRVISEKGKNFLKEIE